MFLLALLALNIQGLVSNFNAITLDIEKDPQTAATYALVSNNGREASIDIHELYHLVLVSDEEKASLKALQAEDGSWKDIDYADQKRSEWEPMQHADRFKRLLIRWRTLGDGEALAMALRSHDYWMLRQPVCPNWWYNEIGCPKILGAGYLLCASEMSPEQLEGAINVLAHSHFGMTGQNRVNLAWNCAIRGMLQGDEALVRKAVGEIADELKVSDGIEGLQKDWSFTQHGPQIQMGNYGLSYGVAMAHWARVLDGTDLDFSPSQKEILRSFIEKGLAQVVWKGYFDFAACGRQIFPNTQLGKGLCVMMAMKNMGVKPLEGLQATYYPCSDFGIYRTGSWYASIRMQSNRTKGFECTNGENMKAYFSSDGELLVRRDGDEYDGLSAAWNWKHIPGATTYDDGTELWGSKKAVLYDNGDKAFKDYPYNLTDNVTGWVDGDVMVAMMEYRRDSLYARKAWFFWEGGIVCLGTGITRPVAGEVVTTLEQNNLRGAVETGPGWARHRGITYISLDGSPLLQAPAGHSGKWSWIAPYMSSETVSADLFDLYISHGDSPRGASYAYTIVPTGESATKALKSVRRNVKVLENSEDRQSVLIRGHKYTVDWKK